MYKEMFGIVALAIVFTSILHILKKKYYNIYQGLLRCAVISYIVCNAVFNFRNVMPEFWYEVKKEEGTELLKYGDMEGNLFAYTDHFRYQDQIIFAILKNRSVELDQSALVYSKFFKMFSKNFIIRELNEEIKNKKIEWVGNKDSDFSADFTIPQIMEYVIDEGSKVTQLYEQENPPRLHIKVDSLEDSSKIYVFADQSLNLYIIGEE